jgi:hypothetical protein
MPLLLNKKIPPHRHPASVARLLAEGGQRTPSRKIVKKLRPLEI